MNKMNPISPDEERRRREKFEREIVENERRSSAATAQGGPAYARLLALAEQRNSGQIPRVAKFIAAVYNGGAYPFDLFELRALDVEISDDMLLCLDALRWGRADLYSLIPNGDRRVKAVIELWGLQSGSNKKIIWDPSGALALGTLTKTDAGVFGDFLGNPRCSGRNYGAFCSRHSRSHQ